jgi:hypothetical protein
MPNRAERRAAERKAEELAHQANITQAPIEDPIASQSPDQPIAAAPNPAAPSLWRHNGSFNPLTSESTFGFEALKQSLLDEHQPTTETEGILINNLAESHWLANRAQNLADSCFNNAGQLQNEKLFALYLRYQTTHTRAFHKSLTALLKLRTEKRKSEIGFEAQKRQVQAHQIKTEQHEMKKQQHYWEVLRKDGEACHQLARNTLQNLNAVKEHPGFEAQYAADLAQRGLKKGEFQTATSAAA